MRGVEKSQSEHTEIVKFSSGDGPQCRVTVGGHTFTSRKLLMFENTYMCVLI